MKRWGFIGAGKMATALVKGMLRARIARDDSIVASDPLENARTSIQVETGIAVLESNLDVLKNSDVVVLAVKPQSMSQVLAELSKAVTSTHVVISIAAGITIDSIVHGLGKHSRVIRVMPNTPALIGEGISAYALAEGARPEDAALVEDLLGSVGQSVKVAESMLDAVTGLSGSGPAFVYLMIEALSDGGVCAGLPRDIANQLAVQTVIGAAKMVHESGEHPGLLKDQVASPGGTTIAGLHALEKAGVRGAFIDAVVAATRRSAELAALAASPPASPARASGR
jgi:pyrroline-5-carboxylate reductase